MLPYSYGERKPLILDFDIECRPLSWYGGDFVTKDVTAIAWGWHGTDLPVACVAQGEMNHRFLDSDGDYYPELDLASMMDCFIQAYDVADIVTGHFIRGFDLPVLNAVCVELGMPMLDSKESIDTKNDLVKFTGLSKSQENIAAMLGLEHPKVQMDQVKWRQANRLTPKGIALAKERVVGDVVQHMEMRVELQKRGMLGRSRVWSPTSNGSRGYQP